MASRLSDLKQLKLPQNWERRIEQIVYDNRMLYEPWIESASSYEELKGNLKQRGFTDLAMGANPILNLSCYGCAPVVTTKSLSAQKVMIQKKP